MAERTCERCGKPILEPKRRKYCTDACADSATRARIKLRAATNSSRGVARVLYRYYPKAES